MRIIKGDGTDAYKHISNFNVGDVVEEQGAGGAVFLVGDESNIVKLVDGDIQDDAHNAASSRRFRGVDATLTYY